VLIDVGATFRGYVADITRVSLTRANSTRRQHADWPIACDLLDVRPSRLEDPTEAPVRITFTPPLQEIL
jgi:hypothetical protein